MSRLNRPTQLISLLALLAILTMACGGGGEDDAKASDNPDTGVAAELAADQSPYLEAALEEGEVTWYTAHYNTEVAETISGLFEEAYPGITVNLYRQTAQRVNQRFVQEEEVGDTVADLLGITEISLVDSLADRDLLAPFTPTNSDAIKTEYAEYNHPDELYHTANVGNNVLCYNTEQVTEEEAPKTWQDLLDPKWQGQVATGHPGASGYVGTWATQMYLEYGVEYFEQLETQDPLIGQSVTDTIPRLAAGERLVAACSDQTAANAGLAGDPIGIIYPEDGAVIMPTPNAIPAGAPHPNAGMLLADFIVSDEVQSYLSENQSVIPLVDGIEAPAHVPDEVTFMRPTLEEMSENLETVIALWREVFGV